VGSGILEALSARPLLRVPGKAGRECTSDLVLRSYALQLRALANASARLYDLGAEGLETGARSLRTDEEVEALLDSGPWPPASPLPVFSPQPAQVRDFLAAEAGLLLAAERELGQALRQGTRTGPAVAQADYILLATPEADPERLAERGNLALALANARWLRARLERLG
jgi:hypothetical protein